MTRLFGKNLLALCLFIFSGVALSTAAIEPVKAPQNLPASVSPELEKAAKALAEGQLDTAARWFEAVVQNTSAQPFIRGLSMFGLAQVALARQDTGAAIAAWERLARDSTLLRFHRDAAGRRISETERLRQGLAGRDPAVYRAHLPVLPEPAVVFHVAPDGNDTADGSQARPFRTFERARDAVREVRKSHGGVPPKGGVRIMIGGGSIVIQGGHHHGIFGCTMNTLGCGGARVAGGDSQTLTPGHHFVENCTVFDISRLKRTYTPAVHLDGCGNRIAHNLFEKMPSSAMRIEGNDHLIELNLIRDVVQESDEKSIRNDPQLKEPLFEPIPIEEIGPYAHPWRAQEVKPTMSLRRLLMMVAG